QRPPPGRKCFRLRIASRGVGGWRLEAGDWRPAIAAWNATLLTGSNTFPSMAAGKHLSLPSKFVHIPDIRAGGGARLRAVTQVLPAHQRFAFHVSGWQTKTRAISRLIQHRSRAPF